MTNYHGKGTNPVNMNEFWPFLFYSRRKIKTVENIPPSYEQ